MFKCEKCGRVTEPREKLTKMPILMRERVYQQDVIKYKKKKTVTSFGQEIIKEINLCERCANGRQ